MESKNTYTKGESLLESSDLNDNMLKDNFYEKSLSDSGLSAGASLLGETPEVSMAVSRALADSLAKIAAYVPTTWVDNSEPDIDAEHLNHVEQGIMRVTDLINSAVDVIKDLQTQVTTLNGELRIKTKTLTGNNSMVYLIRISNFIFGYIHKTPAMAGKEAVSIGKQNLISSSAVPCDVGDPTRRWNIYVNVTNGEVTLRNQTSNSIENAYYKGCFILHQI